jgi:hypothetical protein
VAPKTKMSSLFVFGSYLNKAFSESPGFSCCILEKATEISVKSEYIRTFIVRRMLFKDGTARNFEQV